MKDIEKQCMDDFIMTLMDVINQQAEDEDVVVFCGSPELAAEMIKRGHQVDVLEELKDTEILLVPREEADQYNQPVKPELH